MQTDNIATNPTWWVANCFYQIGQRIWKVTQFCVWRNDGPEIGSEGGGGVYGSNKGIFWSQNLAGPKTHGKILLNPFSDIFEFPESKYEVHLLPKRFPQALANMRALPVHDCTDVWGHKHPKKTQEFFRESFRAFRDFSDFSFEEDSFDSSSNLCLWACHMSRDIVWPWDGETWVT